MVLAPWDNTNFMLELFTPFGVAPGLDQVTVLLVYDPFPPFVPVPLRVVPLPLPVSLTVPAGMLMYAVLLEQVPCLLFHVQTILVIVAVVGMLNPKPDFSILAGRLYEPFLPPIGAEEQVLPALRLLSSPLVYVSYHLR